MLWQKETWCCWWATWEHMPKLRQQIHRQTFTQNLVWNVCTLLSLGKEFARIVLFVKYGHNHSHFSGTFGELPAEHFSATIIPVFWIQTWSEWQKLTTRWGLASFESNMNHNLQNKFRRAWTWKLRLFAGKSLVRSFKLHNTELRCDVD